MRSIAPTEWRSFLEGFGHQHKDWIVLVERWSAAGGPAEPVKRRLEGAHLEARDGQSSVLVDLESGHDRATAVVESPRSILMDVAADGSHRGLVIEGASDTLRLTFQTPAHPEDVDGVLPEHGS